MNTPKISQNENARLKLAATYLTIIMCMSVIFSFIIYNISERELKGQRQIQIPGNARFLLQDEFEQLRNLRLEQSREILRQKLVTFNIITLILGSVLSYILARRALLPIEEAFEAQSRFTSDASHEIRTPLTVMKTEIETTLRDKNLKLQSAKETLASNLEEVIKLENLTTGLLQLATHENINTAKEQINTKQLISEAAAAMAIIQRSESKKINIKTPKSGHHDIHGNKASLVQTLVILLDNAVKYSPENSQILINLASSKTVTEISVIDRGPGINQGDIPHVFDRFYRADKARHGNSGYGLGLPIAEQIIASHSGEIKLTSKPGSGTTATITLPKK